MSGWDGNSASNCLAPWGGRGGGYPGRSWLTPEPSTREEGRAKRESGVAAFWAELAPGHFLENRSQRKRGCGAGGLCRSWSSRGRQGAARRHVSCLCPLCGSALLC